MRSGSRSPPLLPPQKPRTGRPAEDHRQVLNGMLWILRTGAPWRIYRRAMVLSAPCRPVLSLAASRRVRPSAPLRAGAGRCPGRSRLGPALRGATVVRAHQHAAGARRSGAIGGEGTVEGVGEALGRSQGGFSTKLPLRAEGGGKPITAVLTAGERHEQFALDALMDKGAVPRRGRGRPRLRPSPNGRGSGLLQPIGPSSPQTAPGRAGHSNPQGSATSARLRQGRLPGAQQGRTADRTPQAISPHRNPLREAGGQLPRHGHPRHDHALAHMTLQRRPRNPGTAECRDRTRSSPPSGWSGIFAASPRQPDGVRSSGSEWSAQAKGLRETRSVRGHMLRTLGAGDRDRTDDIQLGS